MTKENRRDLLIIGGGVAGQRLGAAKWFDPEVVGCNTDTMRAHIVDPNLPLREFDGLTHMQRAQEDGRLTVGHGIPEGRQFDIAYIASTTGTHAAEIKRVTELPTPPRQIIVEKPVASGEAEEDALRRMIESGQLTEDGISVHESYLLLNGLKRLRYVIQEQTNTGNHPTDITVLSSKDRTPDVRAGRTGNEPELGAYGVEFPHTHGAASVLAGVELDSGYRLEDNVYYKEVHGNPLSEATYTEFRIGEKDLTVRVVQGLGPFTITHSGIMQPQAHVPITREATVTFADGRRAHLDVQPAVDSKSPARQRPYRHTTLTYYDTAGDEIGQELIADYPFQTALRSVFNRLEGLDAPLLEAVGIADSLRRCMQIRRLRESARIVTGGSRRSIA